MCSSDLLIGMPSHEATAVIVAATTITIVAAINGRSVSPFPTDSIVRRAMESVGNGLTDLPLMAATIVMVVAATITTVASWLGIPISLALSTVMTIVGLGWGRATRTATMPDLARGEIEGGVSVNAVTVETDEEVPGIGEERAEDLQDASVLFDPSPVARFVSFWVIGPSVATGLSYISFVVLPIA